MSWSQYGKRNLGQELKGSTGIDATEVETKAHLLAKEN